MTVGLMGIGHYPNICVHKEERKVLIAGSHSGSVFIHKSSVNCRSDDIEFPLPFFVFGEKMRTRAVLCRNLSLVTPIHLLLFGTKRVEIVGPLVRLDGWIDLHMDPQTVSNILALRSALDRVVAMLAADPESIVNFFQSQLIKTIARLCEFHAADYPEMA